MDQKLAHGGPFVCGAKLTIADYVGIAHLTLEEFIDFDLNPYPNVTAWVDRMKARPGWACTTTC